MNEHIDIDGLSREELKQQAQILEISLKGNPSDDTIRDRIREKLGQKPAGETPKEPEQEDDDDESADKTAPASGTKRRFKIKIHKDGKDKQPVPLSCNGKVVRVRRGETVTISQGHYNSLVRAVQHIHDHEIGEMVEVPAYPHTVIDVLEG